jgi:hypothetical protein
MSAFKTVGPIGIIPTYARDLHGETEVFLKEDVEKEVEGLTKERDHARNMEQVAIGHRTSAQIISNCEILQLRGENEELQKRIEVLEKALRFARECVHNSAPGHEVTIQNLKLIDRTISTSSPEVISETSDNFLNSEEVRRELPDIRDRAAYCVDKMLKDGEEK